MGRSLYKHAEDGEHGLPALLHPWRSFGVGVHAASDRDSSLLPRETVEENGVPVVKSRSGGGVSANTYSSTAQSSSGGFRVDFIPHPLGRLRPTNFPSRRHSRASGAQWKNDRGGGGQQDQPPGSLCAPPCVRFHCDILEEVNQPYPCCPQCDLFISIQALNGRNPVTDLCRFGWGRKRQHLETE